MENDKNFQQLEIPVLKKLYELYRYAHKSVSSFPKHERYSLGEKIETNLLEAMELIITGNAQPKNFKDTYLIKANCKIEILKIFFRLSLDNKFIDSTQYIKTEEYLQESGRMLGGWIKYLRSDFVKYADKDEKEKPKK